MIRRPPRSTLFPYTTSSDLRASKRGRFRGSLTSRNSYGMSFCSSSLRPRKVKGQFEKAGRKVVKRVHKRSEEHTSELQSRQYLVCRLLLEKKKKNKKDHRLH